MKKKETVNYLARHTKYIDYRTSIISDYVSLIKDSHSRAVEYIIHFLMDIPCQDRHETPFGEKEQEALSELKMLVDSWNIQEDGDIVGYIYQSLQSRDSRKKKGQYFTPGDIVQYLCSSVLSLKSNTKQIRILDPACGSGQFILALYERLLNHYISLGDSPIQAKERIIRHSLYGYDADLVAVKIARYNISRISGCDISDINIHCVDFLNRDGVEQLRGETTRRLSGEFDIIIGNPPWGSRLSLEEKIYFKNNYSSSLSGINTFSLFIERAYDFLKSDGHLAYLIPEAYLNIKAHKQSRKMMLEKTSIRQITLWGERFRNVFAPSISIIAGIQKDPRVRESNVIEIIQGAEIKKGLATIVPQAAYLRTPENIFNINYTRKCASLINTIEDQACLYLKDSATFYLGVVTGNNDRFIHDRRTEEFPDPIITGKDVSQYNVEFSDHYFKYSPDELQQVAPRHLYLSEKKVIYKFIGKNLTFALDDRRYYSLNNVNGFIPDSEFLEKINIESILSILNSNVMQYYYEKNFFTLKVLRGNIERLPIKKISMDNQKRLKKLTEMLINSGPEPGRSSINCRENIEDIIFHEYRISDQEAFRMAM